MKTKTPVTLKFYEMGSKQFEGCIISLIFTSCLIANNLAPGGAVTPRSFA